MTATESTQQQADREAEEAEAAFAAGYDEARGAEQPHTPTPSTAGDGAAGASSSAAGDAQEAGAGAPASGQDQSADGKPINADDAAAVQEAEQVLAGLTEPQIKALLAKIPMIDELRTQNEQQFGKVWGKFGELQRELGNAARTGKIDGVAVTPDRLKRTREVFEELAEPLAADIQEILSTATLRAAGAAPGDLESQINTRIAEGINKALRSVHELLLTDRHSDWTKVVKTPDFGLWLQTLPADERERVEGSEDATYLIPKFTAFKEWREKASVAQRRRNNRLEGAIVPDGMRTARRTPPGDDEAAAFEAGFRSVRGT